MKKYDIAEIFTDIDDKFIADAKLEAQKPVVLRPEPRPKTAVWKKCAAAAACAVLAGGTVFAVSKVGTLSEQGRDITTFANSDSVEKIYDSLEINASKEEKEFKMSEFPGTEFKVNEWGDVFIKPKGFAEFVSLGLWNYNQYPHSSVYLFDVTCDGMRDICVGSGGRVSVYDVVKDTVYSVSGYDREYSLICAADLDQMPVKSDVEQVYDSVKPSYLPGADELGELEEYPDSLYLIGATETEWDTMVLGKNSIGKFGNFLTYAGAVCIDWVTPPVIDNRDFSASESGLITNWERNNPVKIWDAADGEQSFTFEEVSELTITINGDGVFFANRRGDFGADRTGLLSKYYSVDIVKMYSAYTADIDGDGERELCVLADLKTADGGSSGVDRFVLYYNMRSSWSIYVSGDCLSDSHYFDMEDGELSVDFASEAYRRIISSPSYHGTFVSDNNKNDSGVVSWWYRIFNADLCRVFDDFKDFFERPTVYEDFEFQIKEFPEQENSDIKFKYNVSQRTLSAVDGENERVIMRDMLSLYLVDVDGDGKREFCATVSEDWDWRKTGVHIYDFEEDKEYLFSSDDIQYAVSFEDLLVIRSDSWKKTDFDQDSYIPNVPISEAILPDFDVNKMLAGIGGSDNTQKDLTEAVENAILESKWMNGDKFTYDGKSYTVLSSGSWGNIYLAADGNDDTDTLVHTVLGARREMIDGQDTVEFAAFVENNSLIPVGLMGSENSPDKPFLFRFDIDEGLVDSHHVFDDEVFNIAAKVLQPGETYYQTASFPVTEARYRLSMCLHNFYVKKYSEDGELKQIGTEITNKWVDFSNKSVDYDDLLNLFKLPGGYPGISSHESYPNPEDKDFDGVIAGITMAK